MFGGGADQSAQVYSLFRYWVCAADPKKSHIHMAHLDKISTGLFTVSIL